MQIEVPDTFEEFLNGKKAIRMVKPGGDQDTNIKLKNHTADTLKS